MLNFNLSPGHQPEMECYKILFSQHDLEHLNDEEFMHSLISVCVSLKSKVLNYGSSLWVQPHGQEIYDKRDSEILGEARIYLVYS